MFSSREQPHSQSTMQKLSAEAFWAIQKNDVGEIERLAGLGVNMNYKDSESGYTYLSYAIKNGTLETVNKLIELGADACNLRDDGYLPIIGAIGSSREEVKYEMAKTLIIAMDDIDFLDGNGYNILFYAASNGNNELVEFILKNGAETNNPEVRTPPLFIAAQNGFEDIVVSLLAKGAKPLFVGKDGYCSIDMKETPRDINSLKIMWQSIYDSQTISSSDEFAGIGINRIETERFDESLLQVCKEIYSGNSDSRFIYSEHGSEFMTPAMLLKRLENQKMVGADCDELSILGANAFNVLLGVPLDEITFIYFNMKNSDEKHGTLLISHLDKYYFVDIIGGIVKEINMDNPIRSINGIYSNYQINGKGIEIEGEIVSQPIQKFVSVSSE